MQTHKDVEYAVDDASGVQRLFRKFDDAAAFAVVVAHSRGQANLDVLVYSEAGARYVMGDEGLEMYREDPDASVFQRLVISVNDQGRVP